MASGRTLTHEEARRVYDRIGARQDTQAFYEDRATRMLVAEGRFDEAHRVLEFGCGTGRFAHGLLTGRLPPDAQYVGLDVSPEMVRLAQARLASFGPRVQVRLTDGSPPRSEPSGSADRFVSNYVLDLLSEGDIVAVVSEARRILVPDGLLCLTSLSTGAGAASRALAGLWSRLHRLSPFIVGGCRPLDLLLYLDPTRWRVLFHTRLAPFGIPSEVAVAQRLAAAAVDRPANSSGGAEGEGC